MSSSLGSQSLSPSKSYARHHEYIFAPREFTQLQNAQAVALPYGGINPLPAPYCCLKPQYLNLHTSYFDHLERAALEWSESRSAGPPAD